MADLRFSKVKLTLDGKTTLETVTLTVSSTLQQPLPFMGWLSWNVVEGDISEEVVKTVADAMVSSGLAAAGYNYLCIDDLWHAAEREAGTDKPLYDAEKFPNGMKAVSDYVHSKGLKFGIYSDAGTKTCAGCFGSVGYEEIDAQQYAEWEVDLLKYDYCNAPTDVETCRERYKAMGDALKTKTITLSCGKLMTGVTVRPWTGIFMLRNLKSPETYFQAAFRVQSPWEVSADDGSREIVKKE